MHYNNPQIIRSRKHLLGGLCAVLFCSALSVWGAVCPLPDSATTVGIPSPATFNVVFNNGFNGSVDGGSYFNATIEPSGTYAGGSYKAWCSDAAADIFVGQSYTGTIIDSQFTSCPNAVHGSCVPPVIYQPDGSFLPNACVWNEINYLINHKLGSTDSVQAAIWDLISPPDAAALATTPNINQADRAAMVAAAKNNSSFVPGPGQVRAAILYVQDNVQIIFIEVQVPSCTGQIGDFIWNDLNGNGCQDAGEPGIQGVTVDLYSGSSCGTGKGGMIQSTTTDASGHYLFSGLCAGDYTVTITTPNGFVHTLALQGCGATPAESQANDSNCQCTGADICDVCVNLPTDNSSDLTIDCGYKGMQQCLTLTKTADALTAPAGGRVGYTYTIFNCGGTAFENLAIVDDAGTPGYTADDFSVISGLNLAPGETESYHVFVNLPVVECVSNSNPSVTAGLLTVQTNANGDFVVSYRQSRGLNDNVYGSNAPADGWSQHKFSDLTGSDQCEFRFTDGTGKVVLDFQSDYITQTTSNALHPSGYASLGPNGGDGKMITGTASSVLFYTSTLADNLNSGLNGGFPSPYLVNSPTPESAHTDWDYVDGYTVIVSKGAFGAAGFGGVTVPEQHNSPAKTGSNLVNPLPCGGCITNIATVWTVDGNNNLITPLAHDDAIVCTGTSTPPPDCTIIKGAMKIGPNNITIPLKNAGTASIVLSEVDLTWKQSVNGKINKMSLNGDFFTPAAGAGATSPATITGTFVADPNKRTIAPGKTLNLTIQFEHPADKTVGDYTAGAIKFGTCTVNFP